MREIYFDNSASTKVSKEAAAAAITAMEENFGNPSSLHGKGLAALQMLTQTRLALARALGAAEQEIIFTSGGSEANNMALLGVAEMKARQGGTILVTAAEHPSLLEPTKYLMQKGFDVQYIPVDEQGAIDIEFFVRMLTSATVFVGVHQVNNETGTIQDIIRIGDIIHEKAPQAFYHIDGVQGLGKLPVDLKSTQANSFAISGHKIHAPKGIGALWLKQGCRLPSLIKGGGQERGFRSGTENMPGIAALAIAVTTAIKEEERVIIMNRVRLALANKILAIEDSILNGPPLDKAAPHILNVSFVGVKSEVLLHFLEQEGVYISAGSACSSRKTTASHVLQAMGLSAERLGSAVRFSFSALNTVDEANEAANIIEQAVKEIRSLNKGRRKKNI
ncbi:MAG: cysteine desulfurase [Firmicutes bacterium]|nr:cysteine desulfurase [Bacillota bacterium]